MVARIAVVYPFDPSTAATALRDAYVWNIAFLQFNPSFPRLYDLFAHGAMRYEREPRGCSSTECTEERFLTIPLALAQGWGDCDDLAPWLAAERTVRDGMPSLPRLRESAAGYHVDVIRADGAVEDPSAMLGMR